MFHYHAAQKFYEVKLSEVIKNIAQANDYSRRWCWKKVGAPHRNFPLIAFLDLYEVVGAIRYSYGIELEGFRLTERISYSDYIEDGIILTRTPCFLFSKRVSRPMWKRWRM